MLLCVDSLVGRLLGWLFDSVCSLAFVFVGRAFGRMFACLIVVFVCVVVRV